MKINAKDIAQLRKQTGVGMMDAKQALVEAGGDFDQAIELLRRKGAIKAAKKSDRETREGIVFSYVHGDKIGVLLELNCETDFVARNEEFRALAHEIALQIAAMNPLYISEEDVPQEVLEKERALIVEQLAEEKKPTNVMAQIVDGKIAKFLEEVVLLNQPYIKDENRSIKQLIEEAIQKLGENIQVGRFTRYSIEDSPVAC